MISIDQYIRILQEFPLKKFPLAAHFIVNEMAFQARQKAVEIVGKKMIIRNRYVQNRVQFERSPRTFELGQIKSRMGSPLISMLLHEQGYVNRNPKIKGTYGKFPVPTRAARVGTTIQGKRRKKDRLTNLKIITGGRYKGKTPLIRSLIMIQDQARKNRRNPMNIPFKNKPGIYVLSNVRKAKRKPKFKGRKKPLKTVYEFKLKKLYALQSSPNRIKKRPWMTSAVAYVVKQQPRIVQQAWNKFLSKVR